MPASSARLPVVGPQRQDQPAGGVRGDHDVGVPVALGDPLPGGVELGEVLGEVGDVGRASGAARRERPYLRRSRA